MSQGKMMGKAMHFGAWWIDRRSAGAGRATEARSWLDEAQGEILDAEALEDPVEARE